MAVPSYFSAINSESLPQREIFSLDLFSVGPHSNYISAAFFFLMTCIIIVIYLLMCSPWVLSLHLKLCNLFRAVSLALGIFLAHNRNARNICWMNESELPVRTAKTIFRS